MQPTPLVPVALRFLAGVQDDTDLFAAACQQAPVPSSSASSKQDSARSDGNPGWHDVPAQVHVLGSAFDGQRLGRCDQNSHVGQKSFQKLLILV